MPISARRLRANQANARAGTGPRTDVGKRRAAANARHHGLNVSVLSDPALFVEAQKLASAVAGEGARDVHREAALRVAIAQIECKRARQERQRQMTMAIADGLPVQLGRLHRYQRRALSRLRNATRSFDAMVAALTKPKTDEET